MCAAHILAKAVFKFGGNMFKIGKDDNGRYFIETGASYSSMSLSDLQVVCAEIFAEIEPHFTGIPSCPHCGTREFLCGHNGVGCTSDKAQ